MNLQQIKTMLDSPTGIALKEYLVARLNELRDIDNIQEHSTPVEQMLEVKGQKRAYEKLKDILSEIVSIDRDPTSRSPLDRFDA